MLNPFRRVDLLHLWGWSLILLPAQAIIGMPRGFPGFRFLRLDPLKRRDPFAGDRFQPLAQRVPIIGDQFRPIPRPADLDVQRLLRRQMRMVGFHRGDHRVHCAALESVNGGRPGAVDVA